MSGEIKSKKSSQKVHHRKSAGSTGDCNGNAKGKTLHVDGDNIETLDDLKSANTHTTSLITNKAATGTLTSATKSVNQNQRNLKVVHAESGHNFPSSITFEVDLLAVCLFAVAFCTRIYRLAQPNNVVFDELHYGKYVSLYMKNLFFFDQHPPLGKILISSVANLVGYDGNYTFSKIGSPYTPNVPIFWLRFVPALAGSLLSVCVYKLLLQMRLHKLTALLGGSLIILDNALLTQSRFILMEPMLLLASTAAILFLLKFQNSQYLTVQWLMYGVTAAVLFTTALCIKYAAIFTCGLGFIITCRYLWRLLPDSRISDIQLLLHTIVRMFIFTVIPLILYLGVFYVHLNTLYKAGPHDIVMTSAFQASLEGGLASITKGQPLKVVHGSQITLRHTLGRTCWLHSHAHVYPVRYPDKRGSSHQQQVTCYSFKDVNNWWIVKRPDKGDLVVSDIPDVVRHGDVVQLVHGITSRALNSHDVAAAMTPSCQEVSCYIDYNVSMSAQILWKIDVVNRETDQDEWHAITSQVRLLHVPSGHALRFSGKQLPEWGFNQHEVVADRVVNQEDTIWNVEEHRYTKTEDQKERESQLIKAEMIPTEPTFLTFWDKFLELQNKILWHPTQMQPHMYSSGPLEWPVMSKGIAYWIDKESNAQIHFLGNIAIWYSGTASLVIYAALYVFYLLRRRRLCFDLSDIEWQQFVGAGELFVVGYLMHYLPYFFFERTMFLHNYLPAFIFKLLNLCFVVEHLHFFLRNIVKSQRLAYGYLVALSGWFAFVVYVFVRFLALSYGFQKLTPQEVVDLRWKSTWDFILHKQLP